MDKIKDKNTGHETCLADNMLNFIVFNMGAGYYASDVVGCTEVLDMYKRFFPNNKKEVEFLAYLIKNANAVIEKTKKLDFEKEAKEKATDKGDTDARK